MLKNCHCLKVIGQAKLKRLELKTMLSKQLKNILIIQVIMMKSY